MSIQKTIKRAIITPTFQPHFKYVIKYLKSAMKYLSDPENIVFVFTVSESDVEVLDKLIESYKSKLNIEIVSFDSIIEKFNLPYSDKDLLVKYGKFSYQTLKKFYTMLYTDYEQFLVLDSESMFIKETQIDNLFNEFFSSPFITVCNLSSLRQVGDFKRKVMENIAFVIDREKDDTIESDVLSIKDTWFLENFIWFYSRDILIDMFEEIGNPLSIVDEIYENIPKTNREQGIFEICLYQAYLYKNNNRYNYGIIDTNTILSTLNKLEHKAYEKYKNEYFSLWQGEFGILEMAMTLLNKDNYKIMAQIFSEYKFNIVRCDFTNLHNYKAQMEFLTIFSPNILAASQNHTWGINHNTREKIWCLLVWNNVFARYIYNDIKNILRPITPFVMWLKYPYYLGKHSILWAKGLVENVNIFIKNED